MIFVQIKSGLGNQLFQYAIGRQLALAKQTALKLDVSFFQNEGEVYAFDQLTRSFKLGHYNIQAGIATSNEVQKLIGSYRTTGLHQKVFRRTIKLIPRYKRHLFTEKEWWTFDPDLYKVKEDVYIEGYWQDYHYYQQLPPQLLIELTLKDTYTNIYKKAITEDSFAVSLHIRRGDYINDGLFAAQPLSYYKAAVEIITEKIKTPSFYIFSDDLQWVKDNLKLDANVTYVEGMADYIDLDLMSRCRHNIIANSSFSWWGAMLNQNTNKIVIAPSRWVKPDDINQRIQVAFPDWIKI